ALALREDPGDLLAEAAAAAIPDPRRRRRWRAQPEPAAAEPSAGQRPRRDARTPSRYSVSGVGLVDEVLHGRPRRCSRTRTYEPSAPSGGDIHRSAEVVLPTHPPRHEEPPGRRLRSRRRAVRQPLRGPDDRRSDRTAHLS